MEQEQLKQLKSSAKVVARELEALGYPKIPHTQILGVLSKSVGFESWNALRVQATALPAVVAAPEKQLLRYPAHYVSASYAIDQFLVDVILWEDPVLNLGYGYYVYDKETGKCFTPIKELLFDHHEMPTYEDVQGFIENTLEYLGECSVCHKLSEELDGLETDTKCHKTDCCGKIKPFLKIS